MLCSTSWNRNPARILKQVVDLLFTCKSSEVGSPRLVQELHSALKVSDSCFPPLITFILMLVRWLLVPEASHTFSKQDKGQKVIYVLKKKNAFLGVLPMRFHFSFIWPELVRMHDPPGCKESWEIVFNWTHATLCRVEIC